MRLFVAIELPQHLRADIARASRVLHGSGLPVRWVEPERMHLTLRFLGEVDDERVDGVTAAAGRAAEACRRFELGFEPVGAFPSLLRPRVVWLGVEAHPELHRLRETLEGELESAGMERDSRPYHPHLTLGRVRGPARRPKRAGPTEPRTRKSRPGDSLETLARQVELPGTLLVAHVALIRSRLRPAGAEHTRLAALALAG